MNVCPKTPDRAANPVPGKLLEAELDKDFESFLSPLLVRERTIGCACFDNIVTNESKLSHVHQAGGQDMPTQASVDAASPESEISIGRLPKPSL